MVKTMDVWLFVKKDGHLVRRTLAGLSPDVSKILGRKCLI